MSPCATADIVSPYDKPPNDVSPAPALPGEPAIDRVTIHLVEPYGISVDIVGVGRQLSAQEVGGRGLEHRQSLRKVRHRARDQLPPSLGEGSERPAQHAHDRRRLTVQQEEHGQDGQGGQSGQRSPELEEPEQGSASLGRRHGEHVEVQREEDEDGDEVDQALQDDLGEAGGGADRPRSLVHMPGCPGR